MKQFILKRISILLCCLLVLPLIPPKAAASTVTAADITASTTIVSSGFNNSSFLTDGNTKTYYSSSGNASITLTNSAGIAGIYLLFDEIYGSYTIKDNGTGTTITAGEQNYLHEFVQLDAAFGTLPTSITIAFSNGSVRLSELYAFSQGQTPDFVQVWNKPLEGGADLVLFATHGDDDQLYFAGLLPYYAGELGYRVQVVYMTGHRSGAGNSKVRMHEMLNGLWAVGVTAYPVFGDFADFRIDSKQDTYNKYLNTYGVTQNDLQRFVVEQVRRFKPLVAVGHDPNGEYGHGMHQVYSELLRNAVTLTNDPEAFPESAAKYGLWEIPKVYLHLYDKNTITMDYDRPLEHFNGMTAFEATQKLGFAAHESQIKYFGDWLYGYNNEITKATQIKQYNPCKFGLYHSSVGEDVEKKDLFEHITTYAEQERLEQERLEQERLEQERLEQERLEQERLEQERLEQERLEKERLEQERLAKEAEQIRQQQAERQRQQNVALIVLIVLSVIGIILILVLIRLLTKNRHRRRVKNIS